MTIPDLVSIASSPEDLSPEHIRVAPYFEGDEPAEVQRLVGRGGERLVAGVERGEITGKQYATTLFHPDGSMPGLLVVGSAKREQADALLHLRLASAAAMYLVPRKYEEIAFVDRGLVAPDALSRAVAEGILRGAYDPALRKSREKGDRRLRRVAIISRSDRSALERGAREGQIVGQAANLARTLVNLPPNELTPIAFAAQAEELATEHGMEANVLDEAAMAELGMGCILGVAAGSAQPPRVVALRYGDPDARVKLALIGKGLTFDSGGLSIKTMEGMMTMKGDMGGAAAVLASMDAIARLSIKGISVTGYIGCTENMPGAAAMRPGDVLTALNGETVEVLNTDAEGRLVLADLLSYAVRQGATHLVDAATLTGGAMVALGHDATLAAGRPMEWVHEVVAGAEEGHERAWPMPLYDEYRRAMDSEIADIKNTGGRYASALTAAAFLSDFVGDTRWAHLDIAGTAWADNATAYEAKGGTGAGVGTMVSVARRLSRSAPP